MHYTISSLYTVKKHYLSIKGTLFHFTRISLYTIYLKKQKSCKVRTTCNAYSTIRSENQSSLFNFFVHKMSWLFGVYYRFCAPNVCTFLFILFLRTKCLQFLCLLYFCAPNACTFCVYLIFVHQMSTTDMRSWAESWPKADISASLL